VPVIDFGTLGRITATADTTGSNPGNLSSVFNPTNQGVRLSQFIIYHMVLESLTLGCSARIALNALTYGYFGPATGTGREWFGTLFMKSSDVLAFYWSLASNTTPLPILTCYIVYDPSLPGNVP
jgi:hypothetical protein